MHLVKQDTSSVVMFIDMTQTPGCTQAPKYKAFADSGQLCIWCVTLCKNTTQAEILP